MAVMAFGVPSNSTYESELTRFATAQNTIVQGGASKLWKYSLNQYLMGRSVVSYSDNRWASGKIYPALGFKLLRESLPDYQYLKGQRLLDKRDFQHKKLIKKLPVYDPKLTEAENMFQNGYRRIWNAGRLVWVYQIQLRPAV